MIEHDLAALAGRRGTARGMRRRLLDILARWRKRTRTYRRCFCKADGSLSDHGALVLAELAKIAGMGRPRLQPTDPMRLQFEAGARAVVLTIMDAIDPDPEILAKLTAKLREVRHDGYDGEFDA